MNPKARDALLRAAAIKDDDAREQALEIWDRSWVIGFESTVTVSDPHPKVVGMEMAAALRTVVETVALEGSKYGVLVVDPPKITPEVRDYTIALSFIRFRPVIPPLSVVPSPKSRRKK